MRLTKEKRSIFHSQFLPSPPAPAAGGFRAKWSCCLKNALSSVWMSSNTLWWTTSDCWQKREDNTSNVKSVRKTNSGLLILCITFIWSTKVYWELTTTWNENSRAVLAKWLHKCNVLHTNIFSFIWKWLVPVQCYCPIMAKHFWLHYFYIYIEDGEIVS